MQTADAAISNDPIPFIVKFHVITAYLGKENVPQKIYAYSKRHLFMYKKSLNQLVYSLKIVKKSLKSEL